MSLFEERLSDMLLLNVHLNIKIVKHTLPVFGNISNGVFIERINSLLF